MSSDEDDYMSDKFLQSAEKSVPEQSLLSRNADKRALEILKRKREIEDNLKRKKKSIKVIEQEKREEGLSSAISSDNKGFAMLAKMGYKPGQGIGKSQTGISEPIGISVKDNKSGLGKDSKLKEYRESMKKRKAADFNTDEFRNRLANKKAEQLIQCDLTKSQKICQQLDAESNVENPEEDWFWPKVEAEKTDSDSESEDEDEEIEEEEEVDPLPPSNKLEIITNYLRRKYYYCIWCAVKYESEEDLNDNCSGTTRNDH